MSALIDNYKAIEPNKYNILFADIQYIEDKRPMSNSTILDFDSYFSINFRIKLLLSEFNNLQNDWDEDGAIAPHKNAIAQAEYLTSLLERHGQSIYHTAPGPNGEIMMDIRNNDFEKSMEIILYKDKEILVQFPKTGKPEQKPFQINDLPEYLSWLNS